MFALTQGLRRAVQTRPDSIATHFAGRRRTWQESADRISRMAGALSALGVRRGDRVGILALNSDRYLELMYAIPWIGAVMVPLNTRLAAPEIEYILGDSGAVALFIDTAMSHHLTALEGKVPGLREVVWLDDTASPEGPLYFEDLATYEAVDDVGAANDELAGLFYTGGTTGRAKGVMLSHTNLVVNALNAVAGIGFTVDTTYIHSGPMFHLADGASSFGVTLVGGRHAFVPRFEPLEVLQTIQTEKVTHAQFVPTMINMLVNHPRFGEFDISTLSFILYGASPMPEGVLRKAMQLMPRVRLMHAYGMTEAAPIVTLLDPRYTTLEGRYAGRLKSCGQVAPACEIKVVDSERHEVPRAPASWRSAAPTS
jgi:long-chain acyl-CoA synthetase